MIIADDVFAFVAGRDKLSIYEVTISFSTMGLAS